MMSVAGGYWFALSGLRDVCPRLARFPAARPWLLSADGRQRRRHAVDFVGCLHHDRGDRVARINSSGEPVIAWAEKFKVEQVESAEVPHSWVLDLIQHSRGLAQLATEGHLPLRESLMSYFSRRYGS